MPAIFGTRVADGVLEVSHDPARLDSGGFWVVQQTFEGRLTAVRMADIGPRPFTVATRPPRPHAASRWHSSLTREEYCQGVQQIRRRIAAGMVYQVNLCRVLSREIHPAANLDLLYDAVVADHGAPFAARIDLPEAGIDLVCASPELFLGRDGSRLTSAPIKGTAADEALMLPKDYTENVMITDLVRNDLSRVATPGTVAVEGLCRPQQHPGLVHLVSTVSAQLPPGTGWQSILAALGPPGSVSGAPKSTALQAIADLEPTPRGPYCGAIGWIDADRDQACLAVGIRSFWSEHEGGRRWLRFGTGAGITWESDPHGEWAETALKASRLTALAEVLPRPADDLMPELSGPGAKPGHPSTGSRHR